MGDGGELGEVVTQELIDSTATNNYCLFTAAQGSHHLKRERTKLQQMSKHLVLITYPSSTSRSQSDAVWRSTGTTQVCPLPAVVKASLGPLRHHPSSHTPCLDLPQQQPCQTLPFQAIPSVCMALGFLILIPAEMSPPQGGVL